MGGRGSGRLRQTHCGRCSMPFDKVYKSGQKCSKCNAERAREWNAKNYKPKVRARGNKVPAKYVVRDYKIALKHCVICMIEINETNWMMFALDHRDPTLKLFNCSDARSRPIELVLAECAKCDLMCHNCHHLKTHQNRDHLARRDEPVQQDEYLPLLKMMYATD